MNVINICSPHVNAWLRQFPNGRPAWGEWGFVFNETSEVYDYLVVFDDLHMPMTLRCPPENTIHIATEPPAVCSYPTDFLQQFSWIITQDPDVRHPRAIYGQPGLTWFIGWQPGLPEDESTLSFEELRQLFNRPKRKLLSVIASDKSFTRGHACRLEFAERLKKHYGDRIDFFGFGRNAIDDKLEALRDYRFHVVLENSVIDDYFSEKLTDCFISGAFPIYSGCPNLDQYFPKDAFVRIDIKDFSGAISTIDEAIEKDFDQLRRPILKEARDLAMYKHNLFPMLVDFIQNMDNVALTSTDGNVREGQMIFPIKSKERQSQTLLDRWLRMFFNLVKAFRIIPTIRHAREKFEK